MKLNRTNLKIWGLKAKTWATMMILIELIIIVSVVGWYSKTKVKIAQAQTVEPLKFEKPILDNPTSEQQQIIDYIKQVFGNDSQDALRIAKCESGIQANAYNENNNGTVDVGTFQINSVHGINAKWLRNWKVNVDVAHQLFTEQKGWSAWTCKYVLEEAK